MQKLFWIFAERIFNCIRSVMYGIIYLYKQNLMNVLSKLQIVASHATIGVPVPFLLSSIFLKQFYYGYIQGVPKGMKLF